MDTHAGTIVGWSQTRVPSAGFFSGTQAQYFSLYNTTSRYIKMVDALMQIGGPATCQTGWINEFLAYTKGIGAPVDHVTTHLYPTDTQVAKNRDGFAARVREAAVNVSLGPHKNLPLVMTEFNAGLGLPDAVNGDTAHSASFVLHNHIALQGVSNLETLSYWCFSDVFEEGGCDSTPFHNGYGIQTIYGIPKPVYRAFEMLSALPRSALPVSAPDAATVDIVVAADPSGAQVKVTALLTNYDIYTSPPPTQNVQIVFRGIPAGAILPTMATLELIDSMHANPRAAWLASGSPRYPNATQLATQLAASQLVPIDVPLTNVAAGSVAVNVTLEAFAVARVRFVYELAA